MTTTTHKCPTYENEERAAEIIAPAGTGPDEGFPAVAFCCDCGREWYVVTEATR